MSLGNNLYQARKKAGLSQEGVAERLGVSRQTISKWETGETLPDIRQSKRLAVLYKLTLDELIDFDLDVQEVQEAIARTSDAVTDKIDWTSAWGKKYPVLLTYPEKVDPTLYAQELSQMLERLKGESGYNELDAMLVLKDILAKVWQARKKG
ncbi:MAG: helix-turn-helix domain-containing protein [Oscillospiraceae bacterium]|nr:helix-turn-helix domain-containing protein [Oscillospiraceae bacterium]